MSRILLAMLLLAAGPLYAAHPLITEDTGTQRDGGWQIEGTSDGEKDPVTRRRTEVNAFTLSYGAGGSIDLQLGVPWYREGEDDVGDVSLDVKWRFFERDTLSFALKPGITLPTGDELLGRGTGKATWGALAIASWEPAPFAVHAHYGYRRNENKLAERESLHQLAGAVTYDVGAVRFVAELTGETNPAPGGRSIRYSTVGLIWLVTRDFDLDVGWREGHGGAPIEDAILIGATVRW